MPTLHEIVGAELAWLFGFEPVYEVRMVLCPHFPLGVAPSSAEEIVQPLIEWFPCHVIRYPFNDAKPVYVRVMFFNPHTGEWFAEDRDPHDLRIRER